MAPNQKASMSTSEGPQPMSISSVEPAIASTSKMSDTMCMAPLTRSRARSDSFSSISSESSVASTASIHSGSSRSRSRSPVRSADSEHDEPASNAGSASPRGTKNGGVTKRRKAQRLTMTKTKRDYRPKRDAIKKVFREEAGSGNFILSDLDWSHWKQVIRRKAPEHRTDDWERRQPDHVGYRRESTALHTNTPAVYEFAVVTPEKRKIPVLGSVTMGMNGRHWEGALLSKPKIRSQIDRVLRRGCKLYARKARFSARDMPSIYDKCPVERKARGRVNTEAAVSELRGLMLKVHDYAWRDHYDIESRTYSHRPLILDGVKISD